MLKAVIILGILLTTISIQPAITTATSVSVNMMIVPGRSIGAIRLGMPKSSILASPSWGRPDLFDPDQGRYDYERFGITIFFDPDDTVERIATTHPQMRTKEGIGVGSEAKNAEKAFGRPQDGRPVDTSTLQYGFLCLNQMWWSIGLELRICTQRQQPKSDMVVTVVIVMRPKQ